MSPRATFPRLAHSTAVVVIALATTAAPAWAGGADGAEAGGMGHPGTNHAEMHNPEMQYEHSQHIKDHGQHPDMHNMMQDMMQGRMHHPGMGMIHATMSPGQAAFGTIGGIVAALAADPGTDWSQVDIDALREHLVDMDRVMMDAKATATEIPGGLYIDVTGSGRTREAIHNMIPAHAPELDKVEGWHASSSVIVGGSRLTVTADDPAETAKIRGLGFYGLMVSGSHHGPHHRSMARGEMVHGSRHGG